MSQPRAACILNPTKISRDEITALCRTFEQRHGYAPTKFFETTVDDDGFSQAQDALRNDVSVVIAAGGDGTVRLAAEALAGTGVPLAILPLGTGNLLARTLDLPTSGLLNQQATLQAALEIAFTGRERDIDLVRVDVERPDESRDSFVFTVIAGIGIDAGMISNTDPTLKKWVGWPAYGVGILRWLISAGAFRARYRVGAGRTYGARAASIMVGNSGTLTGGFVLMRDALIDDGLIDMVVMRPRGPLGWAMVAAQLIAHRWHRGRSNPHRMLGFTQGETIVMRVDSKPEQFQIDGDTVGEIVAAKFAAVPGALRVRTGSEASALTSAS